MLQPASTLGAELPMHFKRHQAVTSGARSSPCVRSNNSSIFVLGTRQATAKSRTSFKIKPASAVMETSRKVRSVETRKRQPPGLVMLGRAGWKTPANQASKKRTCLDEALATFWISCATFGIWPETAVPPRFAPTNSEIFCMGWRGAGGGSVLGMLLPSITGEPQPLQQGPLENCSRTSGGSSQKPTERSFSSRLSFKPPPTGLVAKQVPVAPSGLAGALLVLSHLFFEHFLGAVFIEMAGTSNCLLFLVCRAVTFSRFPPMSLQHTLTSGKCLKKSMSSIQKLKSPFDRNCSAF
mmetsp:Transcript_144242/g.401969  ORF Transcript_144242/g.401969 Transcript_144242/m.401969 type:complete len:295 (-) Transcript_144242:1238-2122(-)